MKNSLVQLRFFGEASSVPREHARGESVLTRRIVICALLFASHHALGALAQSDMAPPAESTPREIFVTDGPTVDPQLASPVDEMLPQDAQSPLIAEPLTEPPQAEPAAEELADDDRALSDFWGYRSAQSVVSWMVGDGNQFGDFSFGSDYYQSSGVASGFGIGAEIHFLAGPEQTDMPPRLYNFSLGYQKRALMGDLAYDAAAAVMAASDFEGSSRRGIRFPAHAVGYLALEPNLDVVLGADFLDRADIRVLPVAGLIWRPDPDIRLELVTRY
ncbi:MAG: hypothetical protein ACYC3X_06835 [Pirellulaceae bacterium]